MQRSQEKKSNSTDIANMLAGLNETGNFLCTVVTDHQGFPLASAALPGNQSPDTQSAVVALIQKTATEAQGQLGLAEIDEISLFDIDGRRLVCRPFRANNYDMILAVLMPTRQQSYRRLTNQTISAIQQQWQL